MSDMDIKISYIKGGYEKWILTIIMCQKMKEISPDAKLFFYDDAQRNR